MATIGNLIINIGANVEGLKKGLGSAKGLIDGTAKKLGGLGGVATAVGTGGLAVAAGAIVGIGAAAGTTAVQVTDLANQVDQAQNTIQTSLGTTAEEAENLGDVAVSVFENNFGDSVEHAAEAVIQARKQLGNLANEELQDAAENAIRLSDAFETDLGDSMNTVRTLMDDFGLTQQQAFDFLAEGYQKGLDSSGDFLDSIGEYANQFSEGGASASEFFSVLETGLQGGVLGTDKISDAFKEFRVRQLEAGTASGDMIADFQNAIAELQAMEDPIARDARGIELFGTMWEDLGESAILSVDTQKTALEDMGGAIDSLDSQYDNWQSRWEGIKRSAMVALLPIGQTILDLAERALPVVMDIMARAQPILEAFAGEMGEKLGPAAMVVNDSISRIAQALGITNEEVGVSDLLLAGLAGTLDLVITAVETTAVFMHLLADGVEAVTKFVSESIEGWRKFGDSLEALKDHAPDWLIPGSPTPMEMGLRGIRQAMEDVKGVGNFIGPNLPAVAGAGGGSGGGSTIRVNVDGVSATSITNGDPADEAIRMLIEILRQKLSTKK